MIYNISKSSHFEQILKMIDRGFVDLIEYVLESEEKKCIIAVAKGIKKILKKEKDWSIDSQIKNPFKELLEKKGIDKTFRELLLHEDEKIFYYAQFIVDFLENQ